MKQLIMDVLEDMSSSQNGQVNLASETARETIANLIIATIRSKDNGWYLNFSPPKEQAEEDKRIREALQYKTEEWKMRESWVCSICGKNTYDVDWDYIGTGTNHLGCDLELEMKSKFTEDDVAKALGHMDEDGEFITQVQEGRQEREYPYNSFVKDKQEQIKARGVIKPKKRVKKKFYEDMGDGHMIEVGKLAEEIVDSQEGKWIYESPDGGKTVFRRPFSDYNPRNKEEIDFKTKEPTGRMFTDWPFKEVQIGGS